MAVGAKAEMCAQILRWHAENPQLLHTAPPASARVAQPAPRTSIHATCSVRAACCAVRAACCRAARACVLPRCVARACTLAAPGAGAGNSPGVNEIDETQPLLAALPSIREDTAGVAPRPPRARNFRLPRSRRSRGHPPRPRMTTVDASGPRPMGQSIMTHRAAVKCGVCAWCVACVLPRGTAPGLSGLTHAHAWIPRGSVHTRAHAFRSARWRLSE